VVHRDLHDFLLRVGNPQPECKAASVLSSSTKT
jgi:hypothetical protein